ncbi:MAG: TIGR03435 family protein [Bryobacteraceae bacterium]|jgi:uncharacterized protein (TIGR03435 family)
MSHRIPFPTPTILTILAALLAFLSSDATVAQNPPFPAEFEVASVKPQPPSMTLQPGMVAPPGYDVRLSLQDRAQDMMQDGRPVGWIPSDKTLVTMKRWTLASMIAAAYKVKREQVSGPSWLTEERYDVGAKIPEGATSSSLNEMLQALLKERFGLKVHAEDRELPGYALTVAKGGPKLTAGTSDSTAPAEQPMSMDDLRKMREQRMKAIIAARQAEGLSEAPSSPGGGGRSSFYEMKDATAADIAHRISQFLQKPVVDMTELDGKYTFGLAIVQAGGDSPEHAASQALANFGLKLDSRKVPTQMIFVDSVSKTPTEN